MPKRRQKSADPRKVRFDLEYLKSGVAEAAAIAAGYSKQYARSRAYRLAEDVNFSLQKVARAKGIGEHRIIDKYAALMEARKPTFWGIVEDNRTQLDATDRLAEIIEPRQSQTTFGAAMGHGKDGRPTLQVILQHSVSRPDRSKQAVKTLNIPVNGSAHADDD